MVNTVIVENERAPVSAVSWGAILAGAAVTAVFSLLLLALGMGIGFSVIDPRATADTSTTTKAATVGGIYLTVTAVLAGALGGYVTGRLRDLWPNVHPHEAFFRDTAHGLVSWAVAIVLGATFLTPVANALTGGAPSSERLAAGRDLGRVVLHDRSLSDEDRRALAAVSQALVTGKPAADGEAALTNARRIARMVSFWLVASMFAGALAASLAAWEGGGIRDGRYRYGR
jgi:fumarate reductase subunit D